MTVAKTPTGSWRARVKSGRTVVASRTFALKRDADTWHDAQKRALDLGTFVDPKAGKETVGQALERWREQRPGTVAESTLYEEGRALKHVPASMRNKPLSAIRTQDLDNLWADLSKKLAKGTVSRLRNTLSSFFGWLVRQGVLKVNPVSASRLPKGTGQEKKLEVYPFNLAELQAVHRDMASAYGTAGDIVLVLGLTGIRWGELAALRVRDVQLVPYPAFRISRSKSDQRPLRNVTKGGKPRTVPLMQDVVDIVGPLLKGKAPDDLVFPNRDGGYLAGNNWKRAVDWKANGRGRREYDLRHTAATIWLTNGTDIKTVQKWLGHSSAKLTLDTYSHWMGEDADVAAIAKLNALAGDAGGTTARLTQLHR